MPHRVNLEVASREGSQRVKRGSRRGKRVRTNKVFLFSPT
jgi:hypothetical protein